MRILYRPVWDGVVESLRDIFVQGWPADKVIQRHIKLHRKWGSHDRKLYAESVYDMVRWWRKLLFASGVEWPSEDRWTSGESKVLGRVIESWCFIHDVKLDKQITPFGLDTDKTMRQWRSAELARAIAQSIPNWMDALGEEQLGERWQPLLTALNQTAPVFLRVNRLKTNAEQLLKDLRQDKVEARVVEGDCLQLAERANVFLARSFKLGHFEVQDRHSQRVALALQVQKGQRVIDACAGAGGKSLHLASLMENKGKIIALDIVEKKLEQLRERATRNGATCIEARVIESGKTIKRLKESAERVLLDVPCSGLGVLRRNPDSKWKLSAHEVSELTRIQGEILNSYSGMCKPGGIMVYATCSVLAGENERQVERFLAQNETRWRLDTQDTLPPTESGGDGFYIARLIKS